jgi:hypothetical protein
LKIKIRVFFLILLLLPIFSFSQDDDNRRKAGCAARCSDGCTNFLLGFIFSQHKDIMEEKELDPTIRSLELRSYIALNSKSNYALRTSLGGRFGIFSTEIRINPLSFGPDLSLDEYQSADWQILKLNFIRKEVARFWLGTGVFYDPPKDKYYHEHFAEFNLNFDNNKFIFEFDARFAPDYKNNGDVRYHEENVRFLFRFLHTKRWYSYASLAGTYQKYINYNDLWMVQGGLILNFHKAEKNYKKK